MKRLFILSCLVLMVLGASASVKLEGKIGGKYRFTMELVKSTAKADIGVRGRYQYVGKTASIDLEGNYFGGQVLHLTESVNGKQTGEFFIEDGESGGLTGKWIGGGKGLDLEIAVTSGDLKELAPYDLQSCIARANATKTGSYVAVNHFINDFFFSEENPALEVGFNGGVLTIKELDANSIEFSFDLTCGPTYHMAYLSGIAKRIGPNKYQYKDSPMGEGEICEVTFLFGEKSVELDQQSGNVECGFGARAYAGGTFDKVNNVIPASERDGGYSIRDVLPK